MAYCIRVSASDLSVLKPLRNNYIINKYRSFNLGWVCVRARMRTKRSRDTKSCVRYMNIIDMVLAIPAAPRNLTTPKGNNYLNPMPRLGWDLSRRLVMQV